MQSSISSRFALIPEVTAPQDGTRLTGHDAPPAIDAVAGHPPGGATCDVAPLPLLSTIRAALADQGPFRRREAAVATFTSLGGYSNRVLLARAGNRRAVVKLFPPDRLAGARWEWEVLNRLSSFGVAPLPTLYRELNDESAAALIVSDHVEGSPGLTHAWSQHEICRLLRMFIGIDLPAGIIKTARFAAMAATTPATMACRVTEDLDAVASTDAPGAALAGQAVRHAIAVSREVAPIASGPMIFGHGDPGLNNAIVLSSGRSILVDWEDAGLSDPALELVKATYHRANNGHADRIWKIIQEEEIAGPEDTNFAERIEAYSRIVALAMILRRVKEARRKLASGRDDEARTDLLRGTRLLDGLKGKKGFDGRGPASEGL